MTDETKNVDIEEINIEEENIIEPSDRLKLFIAMQRDNVEMKKRLTDLERPTAEVAKDKAQDQDRDGAPVRDDEIEEPTLIHDDLAYDVPFHLRNKYERSDKGSYVDLKDHKEAFRDKGTTLKTPKKDIETVRAMIDVAEAKGWTELKLKGTKEFKRLAFLEAESRGIATTGYKPKEADIALLNRMREERSQNMIEPQEAQQTQDHEGREAEQAQADDRDYESPEHEQLTPDSEEVKLEHAKLLDHGVAHYKFDPQQNMNYYVHLSLPNGQEQYMWGVGLEEAIKEAGVRIGDEIELTKLDAQPVRTTKNIYDEKGEFLRTETVEDAHRNTWEIKNYTLEKEFEEQRQENERLKAKLKEQEAAEAKAEAEKARADAEALRKEQEKEAQELKDEAREEREKDGLLAGDKAELRAKNTMPTKAQVEQSPLADGSPSVPRDGFGVGVVPSEVNIQLNKTIQIAKNNPTQKKYIATTAALNRAMNKLTSHLDANESRLVMKNHNEAMEKALNGHNGGIPPTIAQKFEKPEIEHSPEPTRTRSRAKDRDMSM